MNSVLLESLYNSATEGLPVVGTPDDVARRYLARSGAARTAAQDLVGYYTTLAGATGFVCGVPGYLFMPVTVPANLAGVAALQLHMCAAIAVLSGKVTQSPETREACVKLLLDEQEEAGKYEEEETVLKRTGVKLMERGVRFALERTATTALRGMGSVGLRQLPFVGGVLSASTDSYQTRRLGYRALESFLPVMIPAEASAG